MSIALPNLDDRRWLDLVEEGRALIPFYSPEWTDHNVHDPGVTLAEYFAWLAEMDIYQINRVPERHLRKFLALVGVHPDPPLPALSVLDMQQGGSRPLRIPASLEFEGEDAFGQKTRFRSLHNLFVAATELAAIQIKDGSGFHDLTGRWQRGEALEIFGEDPGLGVELYLGFTHALPRCVPMTLAFISQEFSKGEAERECLMKERDDAAEACRARAPRQICEPVKQLPSSQTVLRRPPARLKHHSIRLAWEFLTASDRWERLQDTGTGSKDRVQDFTRAFTLNGSVQIRIPAAMGSRQIGQVTVPLHYLRVRIVGGTYDAPPGLRHIAINGVFVEQAVPAGELRWTIASLATISGKRPRIGKPARFNLQFNGKGEIAYLDFVGDEQAPAFTVLDYRANGYGTPGRLSVEAVSLGAGDGRPNLQLRLPATPPIQTGFQLFTIEGEGWREWELRRDFDASKRADAHFLLDAAEGVVSFGDGENGRTPPEKSIIVVRYDATRAEVGNLQSRRITALADSPHNRALLGNKFKKVRDGLNMIVNPLPASGGRAAEPLAHAEGRAIEVVDKPLRAVTLGDYQTLVLETPGVRIARATAFANLHPSFSCMNATGIITVVVLPFLPVNRPMPASELLRLVANYLSRHRVIGSRVEVIGPTYVEVTVRAQVKSRDGVNKADLNRRIVDSLNRFFHPLRGGADGAGWPFGRDVYRSEVLQVIDETVGADHVLSLSLVANGGEPQCANLCLKPGELVAAGDHQIEVV